MDRKRTWSKGLTNENGVPVEPKDIFRQRIRKFALELNQMAEIQLAVVGHGDAFKELVGLLAVAKFSGVMTASLMQSLGHGEGIEPNYSFTLSI